MTNPVNKSFFHNILYTLFLITISVVIISCNFINPPELIDIENVEINDLNKDTLQLNLILKIHNNNSIRVKAKKITFDLKVNDIYIANGIVIDDVNIKSNDTSEIEVIIYIEKKCISDLIEIQDSLQLNIIGSAKIPLLNYRLRFNEKLTISISEYMNQLTDNVIKKEDIKLEELKIKSVNISNTVVKSKINFTNSSGLSYTISKLNILFFNDKNLENQLGASIPQEDIMIYNDTSTIIKTIIKLDNMKMGLSLLNNSLNKNNIMYMKISTHIKYHNINFPIILIEKITYNPLTLKIDF